jgi:hypothetical protein
MSRELLLQVLRSRGNRRGLVMVAVFKERNGIVQQTRLISATDATLECTARTLSHGDMSEFVSLPMELR